MQSSPFQHAAVAVDISESGDVMISALEGFKEFGTQKITLITVESLSPADEKDPANPLYQERLGAYRERLEKQGFEVETVLRSGLYFYPPTEILETAASQSADYIIVGSRGRNMVKEMLMGGTASEVLQRSELPVFLVRMEIREEQETAGERRLVVRGTGESVLRHVLHPTDFSETADRAFEVIRGLDRAGKIGKVSLIHVQGHHAIALKDPVSLGKLTERTTTDLNNMRNMLSDNTREDCELIITYGTPGKEIVNAAKENQVSLTIMGSQGKGFVQEIFLGGVSTQVTRFGHSHVMVVPAKR